MATTPWKSAGTGQSLAYEGTTAWTNPGNIGASDNVYASQTAGGKSGSVASRHLRATNFGFTTSDVPSGATINGIEVEIERAKGSSSSYTATDAAVILVNGTASSTADHLGSNKASASAWPDADGTASYGGAADLWSATLTDSIVRGSSFGVTLRANVTAGFPCRVDHIRMRVHYTEGGGGTPTRRPPRYMIFL